MWCLHTRHGLARCGHYITAAIRVTRVSRQHGVSFRTPLKTLVRLQHYRIEKFKGSLNWALSCRETLVSWTAHGIFAVWLLHRFQEVNKHHNAEELLRLLCPVPLEEAPRRSEKTKFPFPFTLNGV